MNPTTFNPVSVYALPVEDQDLALFDSANDLPLSNTTVAFDHQRIDTAIERQARQAQLHSDAESAMLLAKLFRDNLFQESPLRHLEHLERAEAAAYALGQHSYLRGRSVANPFAEIALMAAWNNGFTEAARQDVVVPVPGNEVEASLWNDGIDTDTGNSQYPLAAIALLRLSDLAATPRLKARAQRLAQEMLAYQQGSKPTPRRQQEIDRFLSLQTGRLAAAIDFSGF